MKVNDVPKYTSVETVMQLTRRQRQILWRHCKGGRSCYLVDVNYSNGDFFENCFDYRGVFVGEYVTHSYMSEEAKNDKEHKALEIIKNKNVWAYHLKQCNSLEEYNEVFVDELHLTTEEYDLLKEVLL